MSLSYAHLINPNLHNERPSHVLFFDVESHLVKADNHRTRFNPFLWTAVYKHYRYDGHPSTETEYSGADPEQFWRIVDSHAYRGAKLYVVSHHLEVDFMPLGGFRAVKEHGWHLDRLISHGRVLTLYFGKDGHCLVILNNGNLFDGGIEEWGAVLGLPKLPMPGESAIMEEWVTYCMRDTRILVAMWDNLLQFMDTHDLGNFQLTRASLALGAYRHRFMHTHIAIHNHPGALALERRSYHGGRFEATKIGDHLDGPYYQLDVNSMYGYVEATSKLPCELRGYKDHPDLRLVQGLLGRYAVIADVTIDTAEPCYPIRVAGKITYPTGRHTTTLTTPELLYGFKHSYIMDCQAVAWYKQDYIFQDFAKYFMALKSQYQAEGNQPMRQLAKFFPNALYGKLGQYGYDTHIIGDCDPNLFSSIDAYDVTHHHSYQLHRYAGHVHQTDRLDITYYTMVAIPSHITAYARMMLWHLMQQAGLDHIYHVATDSLIVDHTGYDNLRSYIDPVEPGKLKVQKEISSLSIRGINDTLMDGVDKIKGIPSNATRVAEHTYLVTYWPHVNTLLNQGIDDHYYTQDVRKTLHRPEYHKQILDPLSQYINAIVRD
jgi:hypothetical protein